MCCLRNETSQESRVRVFYVADVLMWINQGIKEVLTSSVPGIDLFAVKHLKTSLAVSFWILSRDVP